MIASSPEQSSEALLRGLTLAIPQLWSNARRPVARSGTPDHAISPADVDGATERFTRFRPLLAELFPELRPVGGAIESGLLPAERLQQALGIPETFGKLMIKADHALPVAGSIKARGGIHEVLEYAEGLARKHGVRTGGDYRTLGSPMVRAIFGRYTVAVGSTGNLGLAIGVMASALGFRAVVHMSAEAKEWKKQRLRARGVEVVEHAGDYAQAVAAGRNAALNDSHSHFVDDERSRSLLLGYAAAGRHLAAQIRAQGRGVDATHPLFVYLPCGVGGAPGGIALGLEQIYGPHVHCFFAEPTQSPCFMVQMLAASGGLPQGPSHPSVYDIGLTNQTEADGLAVPQASTLAAEVVAPFLAGVYTVEDDTLFRHLNLAATTEGARIEPSAAAGLSGPEMLRASAAGQNYLRRHSLVPLMADATHIAWTTGGLFVPDDEYARFRARGALLMAGQEAG